MDSKDLKWNLFGIHNHKFQFLKALIEIAKRLITFVFGLLLIVVLLILKSGLLKVCV